MPRLIRPFVGITRRIPSTNRRNGPPLMIGGIARSRSRSKRRDRACSSLDTRVTRLMLPPSLRPEPAGQARLPSNDAQTARSDGTHWGIRLLLCRVRPRPAPLHARWRRTERAASRQREIRALVRPHTHHHSDGLRGPVLRDRARYTPSSAVVLRLSWRRTNRASTGMSSFIRVANMYNLADAGGVTEHGAARHEVNGTVQRVKDELTRTSPRHRGTRARHRPPAHRKH